MAEEKNKWAAAVIRLTELTQKGELEWEVLGPTAPIYPTGGEGDVIQAYAAWHQDRVIRLAGRGLTVSDRRGMFDFEEILTVYELEMVDEHGRPLWEFPQVEPLGDLFAAVQYQTAGVGDFLDELLGGEP